MRSRELGANRIAERWKRQAPTSSLPGLRGQIECIPIRLTTGFRNYTLGECRKNLFGDANMGAPELHRPFCRGETRPLLFDKVLERDDRRQLARGYDRIAASRQPQNGCGQGWPGSPNGL